MSVLSSRRYEIRLVRQKKCSRRLSPVLFYFPFHDDEPNFAFYYIQLALVFFPLLNSSTSFSRSSSTASHSSRVPSISFLSHSPPKSHLYRLRPVSLAYLPNVYVSQLYNKTYGFIKLVFKVILRRLSIRNVLFFLSEACFDVAFRLVIIIFYSFILVCYRSC